MTLQAPELLAHLSNASCSVLVAQHSRVPFIAYLGAPLAEPQIDTYLLQRGVLGGGLDNETFPWLIAEPSKGWMGRPGIQLRNSDGQPILTHCEIHNVTASGNEVTIVLRDNQLQIAIEFTLTLHPSGPLVVVAALHNNSTQPISLDGLRLTIPVGSMCEEILTIGGRHAMEAIEHRHSWNNVSVAIENRSGRTSHEQMGVVFAGSRNFSEQHGDVWGVHIAWSGNFEFWCDSLTDAMHNIHVGELVTPGEISLMPGEKYSTPEVVVAYSSSGINTVSHQFHDLLREHRSAEVERPVIVNTWEAVYFNHDLTTLQNLATQAAEVGIERFVLDDGWFHNRRNDTAGLGDWWVDTAVWPDGLGPLVQHVRSVGMEFGLWFEPEMVNPDSNLFRAHPDWALQGTTTNPVLGRNQLVLDMSRDDVRDYLFSHISELLSTYEISYIKWDHNRPLVGGISHAHNLGVYELFTRLTTAFPTVQFESCASGGGRIDMGIAQFVDRFWTSDSIDALDRLQIQKGVSKLIPIEMMGSHIGSPTCHTTGRKHALSFRAATAMFGWLGVEWNLLSMSEREKKNLAAAISTYKHFRPLLHSGQYIRNDHTDSTMHIHGVIARDASEALFSVSRVANSSSHRTAPLLISDLSSQTTYRVRRIEMGTPRWALHRQLPNWVTEGLQATGEQLAHVGLPLPPLLPESSMLIHLAEVKP